MKAYNKNNSVFRVIILLLVLCDLSTLAILFARLNTFAPAEFRNVISITKSSAKTSVTQITSSEAVDDISDNSFFKTYDKDSAWLSKTSLDIFSIEYGSDDSLTVKTDNGDKIIAPGTSDEYVFTLENTGDALIDYEMSIKAYVEGTDLKLPIKTRVWDYTGKYILGDETTKSDVMNLNQIEERAKLSKGRFAVYTLEWEWPYESGNDEYDTMLGNLSVDDKITLTIEIDIIASYDYDDATDTFNYDDIIVPYEEDDTYFIIIEESSEENTENSTEKITEENTEDITENNTEEITEENTEDITENNIEDTTKTPENSESTESQENTEITFTETSEKTTKNGKNTTAYYNQESNENASKQKEYGIEKYSTNPKTGYALGLIPLIMTVSIIIMLIAGPKHKDNK